MSDRPLPSPLCGLLLDMDGTLVDTEPLHFRSAIAVLARHDVTIEFKQLLGYVGWSELNFWEDLKRRLTISLPAATLLRERTEVFLEMLHEVSLDPLPGVSELLDWADAEGLPKAVASSSTRTIMEATLRAAGLLDRIQSWRSGHEDVPPGRGKPEPDVYLLAAEDLGVAATDCVAIEDSGTGSQAAIASGAYVFGVSCPSHPADSLPGVHHMAGDMHAVLTALRDR